MTHAIFDRVDREKVLWINYLDYAAKLLADGNVQWMNIAECIAWYRKAQSLLKSDVLHIDVELICSQFIESDASLKSSIAAKNKSTAPLKELLAYEPLRAHISELVSALRTTFPDLLLILVCPAPGEWVSRTYLQAFPDTASPSIAEDEVDYGSLYTADFLRIFSGANVDGLLIKDGVLTEELVELNMPCYQTIINLASQYRWRFGFQFSDVASEDLLPDVDFIITPLNITRPNLGLELGSLFWEGGASSDLHRHCFHYVQVPSTSEPEIVLEALAEARNAA